MSSMDTQPAKPAKPGSRLSLPRAHEDGFEQGPRVGGLEGGGRWWKLERHAIGKAVSPFQQT